MHILVHKTTPYHSCFLYTWKTLPQKSNRSSARRISSLRSVTFSGPKRGASRSAALGSATTNSNHLLARFCNTYIQRPFLHRAQETLIIVYGESLSLCVCVVSFVHRHRKDFALKRCFMYARSARKDKTRPFSHLPVHREPYCKPFPPPPPIGFTFSRHDHRSNHLPYTGGRPVIDRSNQPSPKTARIKAHHDRAADRLPRTNKHTHVPHQHAETVTERGLYPFASPCGSAFRAELFFIFSLAVAIVRSVGCATAALLANKWLAKNLFNAKLRAPFASSLTRRARKVEMALAQVPPPSIYFMSTCQTSVKPGGFFAGKYWLGGCARLLSSPASRWCHSPSFPSVPEVFCSFSQNWSEKERERETPETNVTRAEEKGTIVAFVPVVKTAVNRALAGRGKR